jgi:hypothetical protein
MCEANHMDSPRWPHASESLNSSDTRAASESQGIRVAETIEKRHWLQLLVLADVPAANPPYERDGRYINAPVWPWFTAGTVFAALFLVFVLIEYYFSCAENPAS